MLWLVVHSLLLCCAEAHPDNLAFNRTGVGCTPGDSTIKPTGLFLSATRNASATHNATAFPASNAVDGERNAPPFYLSGLSPAEAWYVDLGEQYDIVSVLIVNVPKFSPKKKWIADGLKDFKINIASQFDIRYLWRSNYTVCDKVYGTALIAGQVKSFLCKEKAIGRFIVIIKSPARYVPFALAEVEVYDRNHLPNIALTKHTSSRTNELRYTGKRCDPYYTSPRANDGHISPGPANDLQCFSSMRNPPDQLQWYRVDLGRLYQVRMMTVTLCNGPLEKSGSRMMPVQECRTPRLRARPQFGYYYTEFSGVEFLVAKTFRENNYESNIFTLCHFEKSTPKKSSFTIFCKRQAIGRYVVLSKLRAKATQFSFSELEVYGHDPEENYALQKPTIQIDEVSGERKGSERATDGDINDEFVGGSCIETPGTQDHEWWQLDLQARFRIRNLIIKARNDVCCPNNLRNFEVLTAMEFDAEDFEASAFVLCHKQVKVIPAGHIKPLYCKTVPMGRHVIISKKPAKGEPLTFCEVEVYGKPYDGNLAYGKKTKQRSTYWKFHSGLAVDGDQESTCSETVPVTPGAGPSWWTVDLGAIYEVDKMVVANKRNCKSYCLKNFGLYITKELDYKNISAQNYELCHRHYTALSSGERFNVKCKRAVKGRYIVVIATGALPMILCELEVYQTTAWENLAVAKPTYQSSDWSPDEGGSRLAVDGWRNTDFKMNSCTMTSGAEESEWWNVDLEKVYRIRQILIVNREDCCEFRLADFKVLVAETYIPGQLASSDVTMCYSQEHSLGPGEIKDVRCNQLTIGQYVIITKNNPKRSPLTLCEVEVYGSVPRDNLAYKRPTMQAGEVTSALANSLSSRANDGNSDNNINGGSCSETPGRDQMEWWAVQLDQEYVVTSVVLYNRGDCCGNALQNFRILLAKDFYMEDFASTPYYTCYDQRGALNTGEIREIGCETLGIGKFIIIDKNPAQVDPLIICEAEVYGRLPIPADSPWNYALDKPVWTVPYVENVNLTVDGDWDPNWSHGGGIETPGIQYYEWWTILMVWNHIIERMRIVADDNFGNIVIFGSRENVSLAEIEQKFGATPVAGSTTPKAPSATPLNRQKRSTNAASDNGTNQASPALPTAAAVVIGESGSGSAATAATTLLKPNSQTKYTANQNTATIVNYQECIRLRKSPAFGQIIELHCAPNTNARFLHILKKGATEHPLRLFEVQIFGRVNDTVPTTTPIPTTTTPIPTDPPTEPPTPLTVYVYPDINKPFIAAGVAGGCILLSILAMICMCKRTKVDPQKVAITDDPH